MLKMARHSGFLRLSILTATVLARSMLADDRTGKESFEDNRDHWAFEFEVSSGKSLGTKEDANLIAALTREQGYRMSKSAQPFLLGIRWKSPTIAITKANLTGIYPQCQLVCVFEKKQSNWQLLYVYRFPPSTADIE